MAILVLVLVAGCRPIGGNTEDKMDTEPVPETDSAPIADTDINTESEPETNGGIASDTASEPDTVPVGVLTMIIAPVIAHAAYLVFPKIEIREGK